MAKTRRALDSQLELRKKNAISDCRMFYSAGRTGSRFPWECGDGWNDPLAEMSYRIEALNILYYPKYRVKCVAEQIKEKFGVLHAYTRVTVDPPAWRQTVADVVGRLADTISPAHVDYRMKKVVDTPRHVRYQYEQIEQAEYDRIVAETRSRAYPTNVSVIERAGRCYRVTCLDVIERSHYAPTRRRPLHWLHDKLRGLAGWLAAWAIVEPAPRQNIIREFVECEVRRYVADAERACYERCEECGTQIGIDYSPRCETSGWITYLCKNCADGRGFKYVVHGNQEGKQ